MADDGGKAGGLPADVIDPRTAKHADGDVDVGFARRSATTLTHLIGNPLTGISCVLQMIAPSFEGGDPRGGAVLLAQCEIERLSRVLAELQSFAQTVNAARRDVDLVAAARKATAKASRGVEIAGCGRALANEDNIAAMIEELVRNAHEACATRVLVQLEDGALRVVDDGPGFSPGVVEHLFEPFFTTKLRALGLGLARVQRLVRSTGGDITACASPLGGAGFQLRLGEARTL